MKKLLTAAAVLAAPLAFADPILCVGSADTCGIAGFNPADMEKINISGAGQNVDTSIAPIVGDPDGVGNGIWNIEFRSSELLDHANGFAQIKASDGALNDLTFNINDLVLPNDTTGIEVAEFDLLSTGGPNSPGIVNFSAIFSDGTPAVNFATSGLVGQQTFTIWTNSTLESVTLDSLVGFEVASFRHLRIDADFATNPPVDIDAPANFALLGLGLVGLILGRRAVR